MPLAADPVNKDPKLLARKFLYVVATAIVLVLLAAFAFALWGDRMMRTAFVPSVAFAPLPARSPSDYAGAALWYVTPGEGQIRSPAGAPALKKPAGLASPAIFFVHPTSYLERTAWNAPPGNAGADEAAERYIDLNASAFAPLGPVWAPGYRQATFGAFLTDKPEARRALDAAYGDVAAAFAAFLEANPSGPIILAGHSQGSLHLIRLIHERVRGTPVAERIVAAYLPGWPISVEADLPALGLAACRSPEQTRCVLSWQSFGQPAEPADVIGAFEAGTGLTGRPRKGTHMLCVNPLTGSADRPSAPATASLGMSAREEEGDGRIFAAAGVGAACDSRGLLILSTNPDLGPFVLPGNNYHVYDSALFWANIRADALRRTAAFPAR